MPVNEPGYDIIFILQVMKGAKKVSHYIISNVLFPLALGAGFLLQYFRTVQTLNETNIINKMNCNASYGDYIPDKIKPILLSRDFLFMVNYLFI